MTLTSAKIFPERKEITIMLFLSQAGYLPAKEKALNNMCHLEKPLCKYVLANTNNIYYDNNTSPRKQHFSASLCLLGHELE